MPINTLLTSLLVLSATCQISVDPITSHLSDTSGRYLFFRGVNTIFKEAPFHPTSSEFDPMMSLGEYDFERLYNWGFNSIRLNVAWEAF